MKLKLTHWEYNQLGKDFSLSKERCKIIEIKLKMSTILLKSIVNDKLRELFSLKFRSRDFMWLKLGKIKNSFIQIRKKETGSLLIFP